MIDSRQVSRRNAFEVLLAGVNADYALPGEHKGAPRRYTVPRRARRLIVRELLKIGARIRAARRAA